MFTFRIITIFPEMFASFLGESIIKRAIENDRVAVKFYNPRDYTTDKHRKTDDKPYSGSPGMVMYAEPILRAVEVAKSGIRNQELGIRNRLPSARGVPFRAGELGIYILSTRGKKFSNDVAQQVSQRNNEMILICGRYEGIDARVKKVLQDEYGKKTVREISIGPYTLTGGEVPAMVMIDAIARRLPSVLGNAESIEESRTAARATYTRPEILEWNGKKYRVPKILLSGHHARVEKWRTTH